MHGYAQHVKVEWVIRRDNELYLVLHLFAQDIFIRNVHPVWYRWPDDVSYEEELTNDIFDEDVIIDHRSLRQKSEVQEAATDINRSWSARVKRGASETGKNAPLSLINGDYKTADKKDARAIRKLPSACELVKDDSYDEDDDHDQLGDQDNSENGSEDYTDDQITDPGDSDYMPSDVSTKMSKSVKPNIGRARSRNSNDSIEDQLTDSFPSTRSKPARRWTSETSLQSNAKEDRESLSSGKPPSQNSHAPQSSHKRRTLEGVEELSKRGQAVTKRSGVDKEDELLSGLSVVAKDGPRSQRTLRPGDYSRHAHPQQDLLVYTLDDSITRTKTKSRKGAVRIVQSFSSEDKASTSKQMKVATDRQQEPHNNMNADLRNPRSSGRREKTDSISAVSTKEVENFEDLPQSNSPPRPGMAEKYLRRYKKGQAVSTKVLRNNGKPNSRAKVVPQPVVKASTFTFAAAQSDKHKRPPGISELQERTGHVSVQAGRQRRKPQQTYLWKHYCPSRPLSKSQEQGRNV